MTTTFFFGWWSKRGLLATPLTLISDVIKIFRKDSESRNVIEEFIKNNTGILRIALEKEENLNEILKKYNSSNEGCKD